MQTFVEIGSAVRKIFPDKKNKQIESISRVAQLTLGARLIITKRYGNIPTVTPLTWTLNARTVRKNHHFVLSWNTCKIVTSIVTMECEQETAPKFSNGTSLNDLECPLTDISRSRYYSTSNNSKTIQDICNGRPIESRI